MNKSNKSSRVLFRQKVRGLRASRLPLLLLRPFDAAAAPLDRPKSHDLKAANSQPPSEPPVQLSDSVF